METEIINLRKYDHIDGINNVACEAYVNFTLQQDGVTARFPRVIPLSNPDPQSFIEYENLTQEIVLSWVNSHLTESDLAEINTILNAEIARKVALLTAPVISNGLPWEN